MYEFSINLSRAELYHCTRFLFAINLQLTNLYYSIWLQVMMRWFTHYLSLQLGDTWSEITKSALEFSGLLLGLYCLHVVPVDSSLELSELMIESKCALKWYPTTGIEYYHTDTNWIIPVTPFCSHSPFGSGWSGYHTPSAARWRP